jgi:hypothetical protein
MYVDLMFTQSETKQPVGQQKVNMGPESFAEVNIKVVVFQLVGKYQRFGEKYCIYLQGR